MSRSFIAACAQDGYLRPLFSVNQGRVIGVDGAQVTMPLGFVRQICLLILDSLPCKQKAIVTRSQEECLFFFYIVLCLGWRQLNQLHGSVSAIADGDTPASYFLLGEVSCWASRAALSSWRGLLQGIASFKKKKLILIASTQPGCTKTYFSPIASHLHVPSFFYP